MVVLVAALAVLAVAWQSSWETPRASRNDTTANVDSSSATTPPANTPEKAREDESDDGDTRTWERRVEVTSGGRPVAGAHVNLSHRSVQGVTNAHGIVDLSCVLTDEDATPYEFVVRKEGFQIRFGIFEEEAHRKVTLEPGTLAHGQIVAQGSGEPVAGALVLVHTIADHPRWIDTIRVTDADGRYTIAGFGDRWPLGVTVNAPGYELVETQIDGLPLPKIAVGGGASVEGRVTDAQGRPVRDAVVFAFEGEYWFWQFSRRVWEDPYDELLYDMKDELSLTRSPTDAEGRYSIRGLTAPRECHLVALAPRRKTRVRGLRLIDAESPLRADLTLRECASLRVRLTPGEVEGEWDTRVEIQGASAALKGISESLEWSDGEGAYSIGDLLPGSYLLEVRGDGFLTQRRALDLGAGEKQSLEIAVDTGLKVTGLVVGPDGKPRSGIDVRFSAAGAANRRPGGSGATISGDDGRFSISGLARVSGTITTSTKSRAALIRDNPGLDPYSPLRVENVEPGGEPVRLVLPKAARLVVGLDAPLSLRELKVNGRGVSYERIKEENRILISGVPLGKPVELRIRAKGFAPFSHTVESLKEGETRDLGKLALPAQVTLSGRVVDESGAGVHQAKVEMVVGDTSRVQYTGETGGFSRGEFPAGDATLSVTADGFVSRTVHLSRGEGMSDVTITLSKGGLLVGRVLDVQGNPAEAGDWSVVVVRDGVGSEGASWPVDVSAASEFRLRLAPGAYLLLLRVGTGDEVREASRQRFEIRAGQETTLDVTRN